MNILIRAATPALAPTGDLRQSITVTTSTGREVGCDIRFDPTHTAAQRAAAIRARAAAALADHYGIEVAPADHVHLDGIDEGKYVARIPGPQPDWTALDQAIANASTLSAFKTAARAYLAALPKGTD